MFAAQNDSLAPFSIKRHLLVRAPLVPPHLVVVVVVVDEDRAMDAHKEVQNLLDEWNKVVAVDEQKNILFEVRSRSASDR